MASPTVWRENITQITHISLSLVRSLSHLIDEINQIGELLRGRVAPRAGCRPDLGLGLWVEDDGAVAVGLEVDADIEGHGAVVEVLHASGHASDGYILANKNSG